MGGSDHNCCVWEQYKYAVYTKFREPQLYRYAACGDWDLIPQRCKTHPKEAKFIHKYAPSDTVLHRLVRFPPLDGIDFDTLQNLMAMKQQAVSALLEANRHAASTADSLGRTPMHLVCMNLQNCGEAAATQILETWPQAASTQDMEGRTPLHYIVARHDEIPLNFLTKIIATSPKSLSLQDNMHETPLAILMARKEELTNFEAAFMTLNIGGATDLTDPGATVKVASA